METIITAATIMAMYLNSTGDTNSQYYYNADIEDGKVKTMYVLEDSHDRLSRKLEYRFSYDDNGRLTAKEALGFNAATGKYEPKYRLDYTYTADGYAMERSKWNRHRLAYDTADIRSEYRKEFDSAMSVMTYKLDMTQNDMTLVDNMLIMARYDKYLLAQE